MSIIPTGLALGVTWQLPVEEKHIYRREYIEDSLCVRMGGRVAELIIYGDLSTGASDDLQRNTELARKMVREWGMSDRVGPMAWGSQGTVFLGEDLMHTRDYSEDTSRVVDEEIARILRDQEERARRILEEHRAGLEAVAKALLEAESIDGAEVARLIDTAYGRPVHGEQPDVAHVVGGMTGRAPEPVPAGAGAGVERRVRRRVSRPGTPPAPPIRARSTPPSSRAPRRRRRARPP